MRLLAVDPSIRSPGVALFEGGTLIAAAVLKVPPAEPMALRAALAARAVVGWATLPASQVGFAVGIDAVVVEWPQWYAAGKSQGDPNDLAGLAGVGAAVAALLPYAEVRAPVPRDWIGGLPKSRTGDPWASPRGARVRARLTPAELALVPKSHDAIDAVGLGLWAVGRFQRARVFPGAT